MFLRPYCHDFFVCAVSMTKRFGNSKHLSELHGANQLDVPPSLSNEKGKPDGYSKRAYPSLAIYSTSLLPGPSCLVVKM